MCFTWVLDRDSFEKCSMLLAKKKMGKIKENREEPGSSELESAQKLKEAERDFLQQ